MRINTRWVVAGVVAAGLLAASLATAVSAQPAPGPAAQATTCPLGGMMGAGGLAFGSPSMHDAVASALGLTSQQLWEAQAFGTSIGTLAQEQNVDLQAVVDAALAVHTARLESAVNNGTLTQAQADAMSAFMKRQITTAFQTAASGASFGFGMMGNHGMMGPGSGPRWGGAP